MRRKADPEKMNTYAREWKTNGLNVFSVSRMMRDQDCKCMICSRPFDFSRRHAYAVDHSHKTGRNRGLLCQPCNLGLGALQDNPSLCRLAAEYLEKFGG